jgi:cobaltochelatase CobT
VIRDLDLTDELGEHDQDEDDSDDSQDDSGVEQEPEAGDDDGETRSRPGRG